MKKKYRFLVELKIITFLILAITILSGTFITAIYSGYKTAAYNHYRTLGEGLIHSVAYLINADSLQEYLQTGVTDKEYTRINRLLERIAEYNNASGIYVFIPDPKGLYYVYNSDTSEMHFPLGYLKPWNPDYMYLLDDYLAGKPIRPLVMETEHGLVFVIYAPLFTSEGKFAGYISADYSVSKLHDDFNNFLFDIIITTTVISIFIIILSIIFIRRILVKPINEMATAARQYMVADPSSKPFSKLDIKTNDELELLQDSLKIMETKTEQYIESLSIATHKAETDPLTQLYNRGAFEWLVAEALRVPSPQTNEDAFILIDFDEFKSVNDTYGHAMGDEALKALADLLKLSFRSSDIVARLGGDEFAVFCKNIGEIKAFEEKIQLLLTSWRNKLFQSDNREFSFTLSIGIGLSPSAGNKYSVLYENADIALYASKNAGRDSYTIYKENMKHS